MVKGRVDVKYFEITHPYYALIKAENAEAAMKIYVDEVSDDDGRDLENAIEEVPKHYALIVFCRTDSQSSFETLHKAFIEHKSGVLVVDSSFV